MAMQAPDYLEPLIGFRVWKLLRGALHSPFQTAVWRPGKNMAACAYGTGALPPSCHHHCGLYAYASMDEIPPSLWGQGVIGAITMWGTVELHSQGMRAQYAEPVLLAYNRYSTPQHRLRLEQTARGYGIDVVSCASLEEQAQAFGRQLAVGAVF
jgi:hypothetical protein